MWPYDRGGMVSYIYDGYFESFSVLRFEWFFIKISIDRPYHTVLQMALSVKIFM